MTRPKAPLNTLTSALEAADNLCEDAFVTLDHAAGTEGLVAHSEIERRLFGERSAVFFRHFIPWRMRMVALLADSYRRYFKLALAHLDQTGGYSDDWSRTQLQPFINAALEWMRDWYILACDGENQRMRILASVQAIPGQTVTTAIPTSDSPFPPPTAWRAPAWLFGVSLALFGIGMMKTERVPNRESGERLGSGHTRLILKGAKRVFLWDLEVALQRVRNEETAAAGAIPAATVAGQAEDPTKQKGSKSLLKGIEGLGPKKIDLSQYINNLTEKQHLAFSLKYEYELRLAEIASRMEVDRKTAYEHIEAARRKIEQTRSSEKRKAHQAENQGE